MLLLVNNIETEIQTLLIPITGDPLSNTQETIGQTELSSPQG